MGIGAMRVSTVTLMMISGPRAAPKEASGQTADSSAAGSTAANQGNDLPQFALAGPKGFGFMSQDGSFSLILHWLLQSDFRDFLTERPTPDRDTFLVRFAGFRLDASLYRRLHSQVFVNFAESRVTLLDAFIDAELTSWLRLRVGKFPFPISEERLTPGTNLPFISTAVASLLLPSRDTGVQALGALGNGMIAFNLALTNGAVAGILSDGDFDSGKDLVARVYGRPFLMTRSEPIRQLALGLGASTGVHRGTLDNPQLPVLLTYGGRILLVQKGQGYGEYCSRGRADRAAGATCLELGTGGGVCRRRLDARAGG